jgi:hypothetical protein
MYHTVSQCFSISIAVANHDERTELRTPLTLIQAPLEQLLASNLSSDAQYKLQLAVRNSKRLKKLIDVRVIFKSS